MEIEFTCTQSHKHFENVHGPKPYDPNLKDREKITLTLEKEVVKGFLEQIENNSFSDGKELSNKFAFYLLVHNKIWQLYFTWKGKKAFQGRDFINLVQDKKYYIISNAEAIKIYKKHKE